MPLILGSTTNFTPRDVYRALGIVDYYDSLSDAKRAKVDEGMYNSFEKDTGFYEPISKSIVIFALKNDSFNELEGTMFHESAHEWLDKNLSDDERERLTEEFWSKGETLSNWEEAVEVIKVAYDKEEWPEELFAHLTEYALSQGRFEKFEEVLSEIEKGQEVLNNIINNIGYVRENEIPSRRKEVSKGKDAERPNNLERGMEENPRGDKEDGQGLETEESEGSPKFRVDDFSARDRATTRDAYERMVSSGGYQFQEAVQDSMLGLKRLYQAILGKGTKMEDVAA